MQIKVGTKKVIDACEERLSDIQEARTVEWNKELENAMQPRWWGWVRPRTKAEAEEYLKDRDGGLFSVYDTVQVLYALQEIRVNDILRAAKVASQNGYRYVVLNAKDIQDIGFGE